MIRQRIITGVIAAVLLLGLLFAAPTEVTRIVIAALFVVAAWEWSAFLKTSMTLRYVYVAIFAALLLPNVIWDSWTVDREGAWMLALAWWAGALIWIFFYPTRIARPIAWLAGALVLLPAYVALDWLYQLGPEMLLFMLAIVLAADIGAYFAGKTFGRVKLAPQISPGKTWEGAIGGMLGVTALISIESVVFGFSLAAMLPLALAVGMISIVGDLTVSMFKRDTGVKDSGTLFPGHGGFLDRADSITAAAPLFSLGISWLDPSILGLVS